MCLWRELLVLGTSDNYFRNAVIIWAHILPQTQRVHIDLIADEMEREVSQLLMAVFPIFLIPYTYAGFRTILLSLYILYAHQLAEAIPKVEFVI